MKQEWSSQVDIRFTIRAKYGLSVSGFVHPQKFLTNSGARPGDILILTKPLGVEFNNISKGWIYRSKVMDTRSMIRWDSSINMPEYYGKIWSTAVRMLLGLDYLDMVMRWHRQWCNDSFYDRRDSISQRKLFL